MSFTASVPAHDSTTVRSWLFSLVSYIGIIVWDHVPLTSSLAQADRGYGPRTRVTVPTIRTRVGPSRWSVFFSVGGPRCLVLSTDHRRFLASRARLRFSRAPPNSRVSRLSRWADRDACSICSGTGTDYRHFRESSTSELTRRAPPNQQHLTRRDLVEPRPEDAGLYICEYSGQVLVTVE
jgi:hypothetical protein